MQKLVGLILQRLGDAGMRVAEAVDADAAGEIEKSPAVLGMEIGAFPTLKGDIDTGVILHKCGRHSFLLGPERAFMTPAANDLKTRRKGGNIGPRAPEVNAPRDYALRR